MVFIDDIYKFALKEMQKRRPFQNTWYNWLINDISEPRRKNVGGFKDKTVSLLKTNTPKHTVYGKSKKLSKAKSQNIRNPFILKKGKKIKI